jgi:monovalent cation/hydrogen antiporter
MYRRRLNTLVNDKSAERGSRPEDYELWRELSQQVRAIQRATVLHLRNQNKINDEVMRRLERELDLTEARYADSEGA